MPIWRTRPLGEHPRVMLVSWRIIQTADGRRHFNGYDPENYEGRVSNVIRSFDCETMSGLSTTGRIYNLVGPSRFNMDAETVLQAWCSIHQIDLATLVIVEPVSWTSDSPSIAD